MKLSYGLKNLLAPLLNLVELPRALVLGMEKTGKRGLNGTYYPTDFKRLEVTLQTIHDVTGKLFEVRVSNGNMSEAIEKLSNMVREEDYIIDLLECQQWACMQDAFNS